MPGKKKPTPQERAVLDYIGKFESSGGDYNIVYSGYDGELEKPLTEMTVKEVLELQEKMKDSGSSAVGAHQFINSTLKEELKKANIKDDELFSPELQDTLILNRLKRVRKLDDFLAGDLPTEAFAKNLSKEFASLPNPETGNSYYDKDGMNKSLTNVSDVLNTLEDIKKKEAEENILATASSVNPEMIINNQYLDEGTKEELLKMNEELGLQPETVAELEATFSPAPFNTFIPNQEIVNSEMAQRNRQINTTEPSKGLGYSEDINTFPADFKLLNTSFDQGGLINSFDTGGSHTENPHGGIPVSKNPAGGNNLVEEGETMYDNYIFSDSLKLDKKTAKRFHIDDKYVGKTLSEISKRYNAEMEERPFDSIVVGTAKRALDKLILVNEELRPSEPSSTNSSNNSFPMGGLLPYNTDPNTSGGKKNKKNTEESTTKYRTLTDTERKDLNNTTGIAFTQEGANRLFGVEVPDSVSTQPELDLGKYKGRGFFTVKNQGTDYVINPTSANPQNAQGYKEQMRYLHKLNPNAKFSNDGYKQFQNRKFAAGGLLQGLAMQGGAEGIGAGAFMQAPDKIMGFANTAFGDTGIDTSGNSRQSEGPSEAMSTISGAMEGAQAGTAFGPVGTAVGATLGGVSSYLGANKRKKESRLANHRNTLSNNSAFRQSDFKNGGRMYEHGGPHFGDFLRIGMDTGGTGFTPTKISGLTLGGSQSPFAQQAERQADIAQAEQFSGLGERTGLGRFLQGAGNVLGDAGEATAGFLDNNLDDIARLAPIAGNLLRDKERADVTRYDRLGDRFRKSQIDKANLFNRINQGSQNARRALTQTSGGSRSALRNNLRQIHANELKAISDAMFQNQGFDAQQNQLEQQFNKDTNMRNQAISMAEEAANAQSRAAADLINDTTRNAIFEDIGLLGREGKTADILENTTGYTTEGNRPGQGFFSSLFNNSFKKGGHIRDFEEFLKQKYNG